MFNIQLDDSGMIVCTGRLDAAQCEKAQAYLDGVTSSGTLDFSGLDYISSAGLGILLKTQKRLAASGAALRIVNVNNHIFDVFHYSGFQAIFDIEAR